MAGDEYSSAIGGGLKLKGAKPSGVKKKKKAKKEKAEGVDEAKKSALQKALEDEDADIRAEDLEDEDGPGDRKTETERRHEEMKRKRLDERLKKMGVKTHKERVEELNKYLSTLSEHHDMPRIGPG